MSVERPPLDLARSVVFVIGFLGCSAHVSGSKTSDVAVQVGELRQQYRDVAANGLAFSADGSRVAAEVEFNKVDIWDWRANRVDKTIENPRGFNPPYVTNPYVWSPDGRLLATSGGKCVGHVNVRIWRTSDWSIEHDMVDHGPGGSQAVAFSADGKELIEVVNRVVRASEMIVYGVGAWDHEWVAPLEMAPEAVAASPDGDLVAVSGRANGALATPVPQLLGAVAIVSLSQRKVLRVIHGLAHGSVAWSPDGQRIVVEGNLYVEIYVAASGQRLSQERIDQSGSRIVLFTQDGRYLIESDFNGRGKGLGVNIWDGSRHHLLQTIPGDVAGIASSPDGRYLAVGSTGRVSVWQIK
jgi:WD40 repeat protein